MGTYLKKKLNTNDSKRELVWPGPQTIAFILPCGQFETRNSIFTNASWSPCSSEYVSLSELCFFQKRNRNV